MFLGEPKLHRLAVFTALLVAATVAAWAAERAVTTAERVAAMLVGNPARGEKGVLVIEGSARWWWEHSKSKKLPTVGKGWDAHWMIGLDAETGEILWDTGPLRLGSYGGCVSPTVATLTNGTERMQGVVTGEGHVIRPTDGKLLMDDCGARHPFASPFAIGNLVYFPTACVELLMQDRDTIGARMLRSSGQSGFGGTVLHGGRVTPLAAGTAVP